MRGRCRDAVLGVAVGMAMLASGCAGNTSEPSSSVSSRSTSSQAGTPATDRVSTASTFGESDGVVNLVAFARLVNLVRFFHASDQAAEADWGRFVVENVGQVGEPATPEALAALLGEIIAGVGPSVVVYATSDVSDSAYRADVSCDGGQVAAWEHRGVNTTEVLNDPSYTSQRVVVEADPGTWPPWFPDPSQPLQVDLGGGVAAIVPLAVCIGDGVATPPTSATDWSADRVPLLTYDKFPRDDQATRLAAVILTWGYFQHFYPYWDVVDTDWAAALDDTLELTLGQPEMPLIEVLRRLVARSRDGHATVWGGSQDRATPPIRWDWIENRLVVTDVRGTASGLLNPGDTVVTINRTTVAGAMAEVDPLVAGASPQHRRRLVLTELLEGPWGSPLDLELKSGDGALATVSLKRTAGPVWQSTDEYRPDPIAEVAPGLAYLDLTRITDLDLDETGRETMEGADGFIVDLRGYPTRAAWDLFPRLITDTVSSNPFLLPVTTRPDGAERLFEVVSWQLEPQAPRLAGEIAFLTDERAISAAETLLGIIKAHHVGTIIGSPTAGTNGDVVEFLVPGGIHIWMTGLKVTKPDGTPHHGIGIQPDITVQRSIKGVTTGSDELLDSAIEFLLG